MTDILTTIDDTLTFHSAALGEDLTVAVEREDDEPAVAGLRSASFEVSGFYADGAFDFIYAAPRVTNIEIRNVPGTVGTFRASGQVVPDGPGGIGFGVRLSDADNRRLRRWLCSGTERRARLRRMHHLYRMRRRPW